MFVVFVKSHFCWLKIYFNLNKVDLNRKILFYLLRFKWSRNKSKWKIWLDLYKSNRNAIWLDLFRLLSDIPPQCDETNGHTGGDTPNERTHNFCWPTHVTHGQSHNIEAACCLKIKFYLLEFDSFDFLLV